LERARERWKFLEGKLQSVIPDKVTTRKKLKKQLTTK